MEARTKTIEDWFAMVRQGSLALPRFQRHEAWKPAQIEGVLENVLRKPSLPIGALLTLEVGDKELFHSRPIVGAPSTQGTPKMHLLDGQQRMTALWRSLTDKYVEDEDKKLTVFISLLDDKVPDVEIVKRWDRKGILQPVWADDPIQVFGKNLIPASILSPDNQGQQRMRKWCEAADVDRDTERTITELRNRIAAYPIPFLSLPVETEQEIALNVFINMNTSASPLKDFDIVVAQLEGAVGDSLHDMIKELKDEVPALRTFGKVEDFALSVGALLLGKPPLKKTYLEKDFGKGLADVWGDVKRGIKKGITFLDDEAIYGEKLLPTEIVVYLVSALWAKVPDHGHDTEGQARSIIRKALWRASFTDRYLKTSATRAYQDYVRLAQLISGTAGAKLPELFDDEANPLPDLNQIFAAGWPGRKDRLGRAILAVSLRKGGYDFAAGDRASNSNAGDREHHHLFPVAVLNEDRDSPYVNKALNCAFITWATNRKIAAGTPREYIEARANLAILGTSEVKSRLSSHMVPYDELIAGDYEAFLEARGKLIHAAMVKLCNGEIIS